MCYLPILICAISTISCSTNQSTPLVSTVTSIVPPTAPAFAVQPTSDFVVSTLAADSISKAKDLIANPGSIPSWIDYLEPHPGAVVPSTKQICVRIVERPLWRSGDTANNLSENLRAKLELEINGQSIPIDKSQSFLFVGEESGVYDAKGNLLGTVSGTVYTCFGANVPDAYYIASIKEKDTIGQTYAFAWGFRIGS